MTQVGSGRLQSRPVPAQQEDDERTVTVETTSSRKAVQRAQVSMWWRRGTAVQQLVGVEAGLPREISADEERVACS